MQIPFSHRLLTFLTAVLGISQLYVHAQSKYAETYIPADPQVWSYIRQGGSSPDLYTGTVHVEIPIYTYKDLDFELPISLTYSSNGYMPNIPANFTGLGWSLNAGGVITRKVMGMKDESERTVKTDAGGSYMQARGMLLKTPSSSTGLLDESYFSNMGIVYVVDGEFYYETEPDIYMFSFLGHSGKFVIDRSGKVLVFDTDKPAGEYRVNVSGLYSTSEGIRTGKKAFVSSISITTGDGYIWRFGGLAASGEYPATYYGGDAGSLDSDPYADEWQLKSVTAPNGRRIVFNYTLSNSQVVKSMRPFGERSVYSGSSSTGASSWSGNLTGTYKSSFSSYSEYLLEISKPTPLLASISIDGGTKVTFSYSNRTAERGLYGSSTKALDGIGKLSSIAVKDTLYARDLATATLSYRYTGGTYNSDNKVLLLNAVSVNGIGKWSMEYCNQNDVFPLHGTAAMDHWGFFNDNKSNDVSSLLPKVYVNPSTYEETVLGTSRDPAPDKAMYGMLSKIIWPTGGWTTYEYEPNTYDYIITRDCTSQSKGLPYDKDIGETKVAGGLRLCSTTNFVSDDVFTKTAYSYSYGVMLAFPRYSRTIATTTSSSSSSASRNDKLTFICSESPGYMMDEMFMGYTSVSEMFCDGSRKEHLFSSFNDAPDILVRAGASHVTPSSFRTTFPTYANDIHRMPQSRATWRGLPKSIISYSPEGKRITSLSMDVPLTSGDTHYVESLRMTADSVYVHRTFAGFRPLAREVSVEYSSSGKDSLVTEAHLSYNSLMQNTECCVTDSDGNEDVVRNTYLSDLSSRSYAEASLMTRNRIDKPIYTEKFRRSGSRIWITEASHIQHEIFGSSPEVAAIEIASLPSGASTDGSPSRFEYTPIVTITEYNSYHRPAEFKDANGVTSSLLWVCEGRHIAMLAENATLSTLAKVVHSSGIKDVDFGPLGIGSATEKAFREVPDIAVTTWEYIPAIGVKKMTSPSCQSTSYTYNSSGRLTSVVGPEGKPIASYSYSQDDEVLLSNVSDTTYADFSGKGTLLLPKPGTVDCVSMDKAASIEFKMTWTGSQPSGTELKEMVAEAFGVNTGNLYVIKNSSHIVHVAIALPKRTTPRVIKITSNGTESIVVQTSPSDFIDATSNWVLSMRHTGASSYVTDIEYYDALGMPYETVSVAASPQGNDIVTPYYTDSLMRTGTRSYLPFMGTGSIGRAVASPFSKSNYTSTYGMEDAAAAYSETRYDSFSANRVCSEMPPGQAFRDKGKVTSTTYGVNLVTDGVLLLQASDDHLNVTVGKYPIGVLRKVTVVNPDGRTTDSFFDKAGKLVLSRKLLEPSKYADTYYAYDSGGRKAWIISPEGSSLIKEMTTLSASGEVGMKWAAILRHDSFGRLSERRLPDHGWEYFVYDKAGRLVLFQNANLRKSNGWIYHVYDNHGREVERTVVAGTKTRLQLQSKYYESTFDNSYPTLGGCIDWRVPVSKAWFSLIQQLSKTRYGGQTYRTSTSDSTATSKFNVPTSLAFIPVPGVATTAELDTTSANMKTYERLWLVGKDVSYSTTNGYVERAFYHDINGRNIQTAGKNFLGGLDRTSTKYSYDGKPLMVNESHQLSSGGKTSGTKTVAMAYDSRGRIISEKVVANSLAAATTALSYDKVGRLSSMSYGNGMTIALGRTIQGWPRSSTASLGESSIFSETIRYWNPSAGGTPIYGGAASEVAWEHGDKGSNAYIFSYDGGGRLLSASIPDGDMLAEKGLSYDLNGNILSASRRDSTGTSLTELSYSYNGNKLATLSIDGDDKTYTHDQAGNITFDGNDGVSITYNILGHPDMVTKNSGKSKYYYTYLADGTKIALSTPTDSKETSFAGDIYLGSLVYTHFGSAMTFHSTDFIGGHFLKSKPYYYVTDRLGSTRVVTDANGNVVERNDYYPFGIRHSGGKTTANNRWRFAGKESQSIGATGWLDFGARMYDPAIMRWTVQDPSATDYPSESPYSYCLGDPVNLADPTGRNPIYNTEGRLIGVTHTGIQGNAIIIDSPQKQLGALTKDESDALKDLGIAGLEDRRAISRFNRSFNNLRHRPDWDGFINLAEANLWYNWGFGAALYADFRQIDLSDVDFTKIDQDGHDVANLFRLRKPLKSPGAVYGNLNLELVEHGIITSKSDTYNFDIKIHHFFRSDVIIRNVATFLGYEVATKFGIGINVPYKIYFYGQQPYTINL